jgi:3-mercaptopyruvate sulfurtransferase SseA
MDAYLAKIRQNIAPDQLIIIYCVNRTCESSDMVYEFLETQGFTNMRVYTPGWQVLASAKM